MIVMASQIACNSTVCSNVFMRVSALLAFEWGIHQWPVDGLGDSHDDVIKWKHFPRYWPFVRGIHRSPVNSSHKGQWRGALMFSMICAWINSWVNNRKAGDLRLYRSHYDVTVMPHKRPVAWKRSPYDNVIIVNINNVSDFVACIVSAGGPLQWRHNGCNGVSNHQPHDCLLNRLFRRRSKKHRSSASLAFVWRIHRCPVYSPHKWPVTRKMFPFDDVIIFSGPVTERFKSRLRMISQ